MMSDVLVFDTEKLAAAKTPPKKLFKIHSLVPVTDFVLLEELPEFDFDNPPVDPGILASELTETMKALNGLGLSANQCGLPYRVFVMGNPDGGEIVAYFNPKIISQSGEQYGPEGCLSFPKLFISVKRSDTIEVEYQDFRGERQTIKYSGLTSRCFQHELDHMNGILYTRRAGSLAVQQAIKKKKKTEYKIERNLKILERLEKKAKGKIK